MDKQTKIIFGLRLILLVLLIAFLITFNRTAKTDCESCSFEIDEEDYSSEEFFNMYADRCLVKFNPLPGDYNLSLLD